MFETEITSINELKTQISDDFSSLKINIHQEELETLRQKLSDPEIYNDFERSKEINIAVKQKENIVLPWLELRQECDDLLVLAQMGSEEADDSLAGEIGGGFEKLKKELETLELRLLFTGEADMNNCYLTIHSGAGGTESCDWADMLLRMYTRWIEAHGFGYSVITYLPGEEAGIKSVTIYVEGSYAYGYLKSENGVHRLVRISPFDANKKRHTSFCSVFATAEIDDTIDIEIDPSDLRIDTFRASGAGGQHVNTTDSAVRITHHPSGLVISCQAERSQHQNRERAMKILRARLYEKIKAEREAKANEGAGEKKKIEWGSQIRSYVFQPYNMVKDHRTGHETGNTQAVMNGELDDFIYAWLKA